MNNNDNAFEVPVWYGKDVKYQVIWDIKNQGSPIYQNTVEDSYTTWCSYGVEITSEVLSE
jgi:hypothetical protein